MASADADQTVASGAVFTLNGSGSTDPDGAGAHLPVGPDRRPGRSTQDPKKATTTVAGRPGPRTLTYRLTVTDLFGRSSTDDVTVMVTSPK